MYKNVASQIVACQLVAAADGTPVTTGTTTVYVCGDGGSQSTGSVSSGAATHKGNGLWTYAPAQAETNYESVSYTFVNTSGVNQTVTYETRPALVNSRYPAYVGEVGASAMNLAAFSTDVWPMFGIIAMGTAQSIPDTTHIQLAASTDFGADTNVVGATVLVYSATAGIGQARSIVGYVNSTDTAQIDKAWTTTPTGTIKYVVFAGPPAPTSPPDVNVASFTAGAVTSAAFATDAIASGAVAASAVSKITVGVVDQALSGHTTAGTVGGGINSASSAGDPWNTAIPGAYAAGTAGYIVGTNVNAAISTRAAPADVPTANQNADALLDRSNGVETGLTFRQALRLIAAVVAGKSTGGGTTTLAFRNAVADSKARVTATQDSSGNWTAVSTDAT